MAPCVTPLPRRQVADGDFLGPGDALRNTARPRRIGERTQDVGDGGSFGHGR